MYTSSGYHFRATSCSSPVSGGATGRGPSAEAEIEVDVDGTDVIAIDIPEPTNSNIPGLFEVKNNCSTLSLSSDKVEFESFYLAVDEEYFDSRFELESFFRFIDH